MGGLLGSRTREGLSSLGQLFLKVSGGGFFYYMSFYRAGHSLVITSHVHIVDKILYACPIKGWEGWPELVLCI